MKNLTIGILVVLGMGLIIFGLTYTGQEFKRFFKPRDQAIERQVFEQTPSFVQGKIQYISRLKLEYEQAETTAAKNSLKSLILSEASVVDMSTFPYGLKTFIQSL